MLSVTFSTTSEALSLDANFIAVAGDDEKGDVEDEGDDGDKDDADEYMGEEIRFLVGCIPIRALKNMNSATQGRKLTCSYSYSESKSSITQVRVVILNQNRSKLMRG